jgi:phenylacetate-CoA ligase
MRTWHRVLTLGSGWLKTRRGVFVTRLVKTRHLEPEATLDEQIAALREFRPVALIGQTGGIYLLARELLRRRQTYPLRWIVPTGATLSPAMRAVMTAAFGGHVCDMYGAIEVGPIAWQCRRGGYHIDADRLIVEVVDAHGRPVPPGRSGQVVVTNLYAWTMPFIRYRLQDISALAMHNCCCGCRFPLLMPVEGRINDFLPTPGGDLVSPHFFFHIFDDVTSPVKDWRMIQERADHLVYEFVPEDDFDPVALERGLARVRARFGAGCLIETRPVESVPLTATGKRRCIISNLRPGGVPLEHAWTGTPEPASEAEAVV